MTQKYIVFRSRHDELDLMTFVIFSEQQVHSDVAGAMIAVLKIQYPKMETIATGAGFVTCYGGYYDVTGYSDSLEIGNCGIYDAHILNSTMLIIRNSEDTEEILSEYPYKGPRKCGTTKA